MADSTRPVQVIHCARVSILCCLCLSACGMNTITPARAAPTSGRKTARISIMSRSLALHHVDVFDIDGPAVAEVHDQDGEANGRLGRGDGQHEQREHLAHQIAQVG